MEVKLIASDMDGTLLNDERLISKENKKSIRRAVDSGIIFTIATGRMFKSIVPFAEELELDIPLIAYNGALVQDAVTKEVLYDAPVELETALAILDYCRERNYYIQAYVNDTLLVHEASDFAKMYAEFAGVEFVEMGKDLFAIKRAPHKLLIMTGEEKNETIKKELSEEFKGKVMLTNSFDNFIEVVNPLVNKWSAVSALAESKNIEAKQTMCIGDSNNDFEMISSAGVGVAVANANNRIKNIARLLTTSNNENGVSVAIEKVLNYR